MISFKYISKRDVLGAISHGSNRARNGQSLLNFKYFCVLFLTSYSLRKRRLVHPNVIIDSESTRGDGTGDDFSINPHADVEVLPDVAVSLFH